MFGLANYVDQCRRPWRIFLRQRLREHVSVHAVIEVIDPELRTRQTVIVPLKVVVPDHG